MNYKIIDDSINLDTKQVSLFFTDTQETKVYDLTEDAEGWYIEFEGEKKYILAPNEQ